MALPQGAFDLRNVASRPGAAIYDARRGQAVKCIGQIDERPLCGAGPTGRNRPRLCENPARVAEVIFAELACRVALLLEHPRQGWRFGLEAQLASRHADGGQAAANRVLARD